MKFREVLFYCIFLSSLFFSVAHLCPPSVFRNLTDLLSWVTCLSISDRFSFPSVSFFHLSPPTHTNLVLGKRQLYISPQPENSFCSVAHPFHLRQTQDTHEAQQINCATPVWFVHADLQLKMRTLRSAFTQTSNFHNTAWHYSSLLNDLSFAPSQNPTFSKPC